jgi:hypothetical protein
MSGNAYRLANLLQVYLLPPDILDIDEGLFVLGTSSVACMYIYILCPNVIRCTDSMFVSYPTLPRTIMNIKMNEQVNNQSRKRTSCRRICPILSSRAPRLPLPPPRKPAANKRTLPLLFSPPPAVHPLSFPYTKLLHVLSFLACIHSGKFGSLSSNKSALRSVVSPVVRILPSQCFATERQGSWVRTPHNAVD